MDDEDNRRTKTANLLKDDRFKALFSNPEYAVDKNAEEYRMLTPVLSRLEKGKVKELKRKHESKLAFEEDEPAKSSDDDLFSEKDSSDGMESSDDEDKAEMQKELKRSYRAIRKENKAAAMEEDDDDDDDKDDAAAAGNGYDWKPKLSNGAAPEYKVRNITSKQNRWVSVAFRSSLVKCGVFFGIFSISRLLSWPAGFFSVLLEQFFSMIF